jgi:hypothetical protein
MAETGIPIKQWLEIMADLQEQRLIVEQDKQQEIDAILAPVKDQLEETESRVKVTLDQIDADIAKVDATIREEVLKVGASVKGSRLHAIWNKARVSWDNKSLEGYGVAHPEIFNFRTEGQPSVSIRAAK